MTVKRLLALWLALPLLVFSACDSTNPVAPDPDDPQPPATGNFNVTLETFVAVDAAPFITLNALVTADQVDANTGDDRLVVTTQVN